MPEEQLITSSQIVQADHVDNKYGDVFSLFLPDADAADSNNWKTFWIAPVDVELISVMMYWSNPAGVACTAQLESVPIGTSPGSGNDILLAAVNLNAAANTANVGYLQGDMNSNRVIPRYNRVGIVLDSGALGNLRNFIVTIYYKPLGRGSYR